MPGGTNQCRLTLFAGVYVLFLLVVVVVLLLLMTAADGRAAIDGKHRWCFGNQLQTMYCLPSLSRPRSEFFLRDDLSKVITQKNGRKQLSRMIGRHTHRTIYAKYLLQHPRIVAVMNE